MNQGGSSGAKEKCFNPRHSLKVEMTELTDELDVRCDKK
jgi:hypothetical protein